MIFRFIISIILCSIIGSGIKAAPIIVSGRVSNNGFPASNEWIHIQVIGADTVTVTDSLGFFSCTVNPSVSQGSITAFFIDCIGDTVISTKLYSPQTTNISVILNGCLSPEIHLKGTITNITNASNLPWVYISLDQWRNTIDSAQVDSNGFYFKTIRSASQGVISARVFNCRFNWETDSANYSKNDTITMNFNFCQQPSNTLTGIVKLNGRQLLSNEAFLLRYRYDASLSRFDFIDTLFLNQNGAYQISKDSSDYLIKVLPNPNLMSFAATYYPSGAVWNNPNTKSVGSHISTNIDIDARSLVSSSGNGSIKGKILVDNSLNIHGYSASGIELRNETGQATRFTYADANGNFEFSGLPHGKYQVWVDQCGIPTTANWIELNSTNPNATDVIITASKRGISYDAFLALNESEKTTKISMYPNPTVDIINIDGLSNASITITNAHSEEIFKGFVTGTYTAQIDAQEWPRGLYLLHINQNGTLQYFKVIKK